MTWIWHSRKVWEKNQNGINLTRWAKIVFKSVKISFWYRRIFVILLNNWNLQTTEGWNIPKFSLNRWLSFQTSLVYFCLKVVLNSWQFYVQFRLFWFLFYKIRRIGWAMHLENHDLKIHRADRIKILSSIKRCNRATEFSGLNIKMINKKKQIKEIKSQIIKKSFKECEAFYWKVKMQIVFNFRGISNCL